MLQISKKTYEWLNKGLRAGLATILLIIGYASLVYLLSTTSEAIDSNMRSIDGGAASTRYFLQGFYGFLNTLLWIFIIFSGIIISLAYIIYVVDVIRSKNKMYGEFEDI
jgi:hypothetical protein